MQYFILILYICKISSEFQRVNCCYVQNVSIRTPSMGTAKDLLRYFLGEKKLENQEVGNIGEKVNKEQIRQKDNRFVYTEDRGPNTNCLSFSLLEYFT